MVHPLQERQAKVVLVEPVAARRIMLKKGLKEFGINNLHVVKNVAEMVTYLEVEPFPPDWIIASLDSTKESNGFSLLSLSISQEFLQKTLVSFLVTESEVVHMPMAFELGLYSFHVKDLDVTSLLKSFEELFETAEAFGWNDTLTSAHYLRDSLVTTGKFDDLIKFEMNLMSVFPNQNWLVINLAQALLFANKPRPALMALDRARGLSPEAQQAANEIKDKIAMHMEAQAAEENTAARLGLNQVVVVDSDEAMNQLMAESIRELGVKEIHPFLDGESAWKHLSDPSNKIPDLIIIEWRLPKLGGSALLQRIVNSKAGQAPILLFSSLVKTSEDKMLLKEMGILEIIEKPSSKRQIKATIDAILSEDRRPKSTNTKVRKIRQFLRANKVSQALDVFHDLQKMSDCPKSLEKGLEAEISYHQDDYEKASQLGIESLQMGGEDLNVLNVLGRTYMKLRYFDQAMAFFDRAKKISPNNIERLCDLAEVQAEVGNHDAAEQQISSASKLDGTSGKVGEAKAKVAISRGDPDTARTVMAKMESIGNIVAYMNNRAISLASQEHFKDSIDLYQKALKAFPPKFEKYKAIVSYNLALAQIKMGSTEMALKTLTSIASNKSNPIKEKTFSLVQRTRIAVDSGQQVVLQTGSGERGTISDDMIDNKKLATIQDDLMSMENPLVPQAFGVEKGDMRCYGIFKSEDGAGDDVMRMLKTIPKFSRRLSI